jgi:arabinan endo-1,5-alpha-L-arabinosidase
LTPQRYTIAARPEPEGGPDPIEAAFLIERGGWYYLFASYDFCCKGVQSNYYTAYGRSRLITGPYAGKDGRAMAQGYGTVILKADPLQEEGRWRGPGHCAILRDPGQDYIVYHAYDRQNNGVPNLRIAPLVWSADGWPTAIA